MISAIVVLMDINVMSKKINVIKVFQYHGLLKNQQIILIFRQHQFNYLKFHWNIQPFNVQVI